MKAELILDSKALLGEGAIWRDGVLYWVDIDGRKVCVYDPASGANREISLGQKVGTVVPRAAGGLAVALEHGFGLVDTETEELTMICDPPERVPEQRFNDGKCDGAGRFWAGTISARGRKDAALYVLEADHTARKVLDGVTVSNGIVWSRDGAVMYYIDTPTMEVSAFDYDMASGAVSNRRAVISVPEGMGRPDGMTMDADGRLWIAMWDGWCVTCWDVGGGGAGEGKLVERFEVPAQRVTSCAFGGARLDRLFITSARVGLSEGQLSGQPNAGGVFLLTPGVRGLPAFEYGG